MKKLKISDQIDFLRRLGFLLGANIPLARAIDMMRGNNQKSRKTYLKILEDLAVDVEESKTLAQSLEESGKLDDVAIHMLRVGEKSGNLVLRLEGAALYLEKRKENQQKIISALIYPILILALSISMSLFLIGFVFPKILPLLGSFGGTLPLPTRLLLFLNYFLKKFGLILLGIFGILIFVFQTSVRKSIILRFNWQKIKFRLPIVRTFLLNNLLINLCQSMELFLKNHFSLTAALQFVNKSSKNDFLQQCYGLILDDLEEGKELYVSLEKASLKFPAFFCEMIQIAEKTGQLPEIFERLNRHYEREL